MIRVTITGRLGKDPEMRNFGDSSVCNFSVASSSFQKGNEVTTWRNVSIWGKQADACMKYLKKGAFVIVTGEESDRKYDGGVSVDIKASHVEFGPKDNIGGRTDFGSSNTGFKTDSQPSYMNEEPPLPGDDEIPF